MVGSVAGEWQEAKLTNTDLDRVRKLFASEEQFQQFMQSFPLRPPTPPRRMAGLVLAPLLIAVGLWLYETAFWSGGQMSGLVFWTGVSLTLAGGLWLASDWLDL
jgi:hypothetical protein